MERKGSCRCNDRGMDEEEVRRIVREGYSRIASSGGGDACCPERSGRDGGNAPSDTDIAMRMGYTGEALASVPEGANLGLGCGNPVALASLGPGETVVDLGSGGGIDCFLAARAVGPEGRVIGVDMTEEMVDRARSNARAAGASNVEFRLGRIEDLPVDDGIADVVISNCVINLSPDKARTFSEAYRVLRPGGRLVVSDIVLRGDLPDGIRRSATAIVSCLGGALLLEDYLALVRGAGFRDVEVVAEDPFPISSGSNRATLEAVYAGCGVPVDEVAAAEGIALSAKVLARKPDGEPSPKRKPRVKRSGRR